MGQPAFSEENLYHTEISVGEILRRTRIHYGQSLPDIERALRIRMSQIEAIETSDFAKLPGRVYAIGFVRSYAEYLGLDGDKMVQLYKNEAGGGAAKPVLHFPVAAADSKVPQIWLIVISLAVCLGLLWFVMGGQSQDQEFANQIQDLNAAFVVETAEPEGIAIASAEEVNVTTETEQTETAAAVESTEVTPAPVAEAPEEGIILNIVQNSWVEIKDAEGNVIVSRVLKVGDQYYVPDRPDLKMSLGNSGGVQIQVDGKTLRPLGRIGEVKRDISLEAKYLRENYGKNVASSPENP